MFVKVIKFNFFPCCSKSYNAFWQNDRVKVNVAKEGWLVGHVDAVMEGSGIVSALH